MPSWMRMMLPPRRMTPPMGGSSGVPTGPGIPAGVSAPDSGFFDGADLPQIDYSHLDDNVLMPHSVFGSTRAARGIDNALLALATFKPGQTTGENISAVASNVLGLESNREQLNFSRQLSPYLSMEPLLKMKSEMSDMDYKAALADHARAMADYYRAGGRQMSRPEVKQDESGNYFTVHNDGSAVPVMANDTTHFPVPGLQVGDQTLPGRNASVSSQRQLTGPLPGAGRSGGGTMIERQIALEEEARGTPYSPEERAMRMTSLAGAITGAQTGQRYGNTPGFMGQSDETGIHTELDPIDRELNKYSTMDSVARLTENALRKVNGEPTVEDTITDLTNKRNQVLQKYHVGQFGPPAGSQAGPVAIPQPVAPVAGPGYQPAPQARPINIGGIPATAVGVSDQQLAQAIVPPGPKAQPQSAPKPSLGFAGSGRPRVSIAPDGTIHVE